MLSRIADSLFWLNRYMERADGMARVIKTTYILSLDKGINNSLNWRPALELFASVNPEQLNDAESKPEEALKLLILNAENQNSVKAIITRARENARGAQDHVTKEVWEQVNQLFHIVNQPDFSRKLNSYNTLEAIDILSKNLILYAGVTETTMPRGMGWSFMNLGRHIERCLLTIEMTSREYRLIDFNMGEPKDILQWRYLLLSLSGYELYLKNYRSQNHNLNVLHQVIFNPVFTRSLIYSLGRIEKYLNYVISENNFNEKTSLLRNFGQLYSLVKYTDYETLDKETMKSFFFDLKEQIILFINRLGKNFFSYN
jgi:uncharacterized alpha-E superfamily protein